MTAQRRNTQAVMMLGTFGLRPKATLRSRALAIAHALANEWSFRLMTTPWDHPSDGGKRWAEGGIPVVNTHITHPALFPLAAVQMIRETTRTQSTLVHLFKPKGFGDVAARWLARSMPVVVDMDDWEGDGGWNEIGDYGRIQRRAFDWQERTWPRKAAAITVASRELERRAIALGAEPDAIFYVPNGLTRQRFTALSGKTVDAERMRQRLNLSGKRVVLLYTRFVEFNPSIVVPMIAQVRTQIPGAVLLVVGASAEGNAELSIRLEMDRSGLQDSIILAGWAEVEEIPAMLATADVAIHPFDDNLVNRSKCSVKLLELMAAGRPIVTNSVGENAEMIHHGSTGLLTPAGDSEAMTRFVVQVLSDPEKARAMGAAARERVRRNYLWEQLAPRVTQAYERALRMTPNVKQCQTR